MIDLIKIQYLLPLKMLTTLIVLFTCAARADVSPECKRYDSKSEYYKVCASYAPEKVKVEKSGIDLNQSVSEMQDGDLLLVHGGSYLVDKPIKLTNGKGLIPASQNAFIELAPDKGFDISGEKVSCLVFLGNKSALSGLKVDGAKLADSDFLSDSDGLKKVLVYSSGTHGFRLSWSDLTGVDGLYALILSESGSEGEGIEDGTYYQIHKNWLETNGSAYGMSLTARPDDSGKGVNEYFNVHNNTIILNGGEAKGSPDQYGLSVTNGDGKIHNNYLVFRGQNPPSIQQRFGVRLNWVEGTVVEANSFISEMPKKRIWDIHFNLYEWQPLGGLLQAEILSNSLDSKATLWTGDVGGTRIESRNLYESNRIPYFQTREQFFGLGGLGGTCLVNRYLLDNMSKTQHELPVNSSLSQQVCGTETKLAFLKPFERCPASDPIEVEGDSKWTSVIWGTFLAISVVINIGQYCNARTGRHSTGGGGISLRSTANGYSSL